MVTMLRSLRGEASSISFLLFSTSTLYSSLLLSDKRCHSIQTASQYLYVAQTMIRMYVGMTGEKDSDYAEVSSSLSTILDDLMAELQDVHCEPPEGSAGNEVE